MNVFHMRSQIRLLIKGTRADVTLKHGDVTHAVGYGHVMQQGGLSRYFLPTNLTLERSFTSFIAS